MCQKSLSLRVCVPEVLLGLLPELLLSLEKTEQHSTEKTEKYAGIVVLEMQTFSSYIKISFSTYNRVMPQ